MLQLREETRREAKVRRRSRRSQKAQSLYVAFARAAQSAASPSRQREREVGLPSRAACAGVPLLGRIYRKRARRQPLLGPPYAQTWQTISKLGLALIRVPRAPHRPPHQVAAVRSGKHSRRLKKLLAFFSFRWATAIDLYRRPSTPVRCWSRSISTSRHGAWSQTPNLMY